MSSPHQIFLEKTRERLGKAVLADPSRRYVFTRNAQYKMKQYRLSEQRVRSVAAHPDRIENGIANGTIAVMKVAGTSKNRQEIWVLYQIKKQEKPEGNFSQQNDLVLNIKKENQLCIISVWRYPGTSPERDPIPQEIMDEVRDVLEI